jgi:cytoskeletal protein CcmA (bactofilin family)
VLWFYVDTASGAPTATEWGNIFNNVRAAKGDFYAIASGSPSTAFIGLFSAFDGLSPWINLGIWDGTSGSTVNAHAQAYAQRLHQNLIANVPPGKVVFGGVGPGFDDFTNSWSGPCQSRQLPRPSEAAPRNPAVLAGMIDYLKTTSIRGVILQTWDDWTEGSQLEPSVEEGPSRLVLLRQKLGELYGDAPDAAGDSALSARWQNYGQARNCGPSFKTPPQTVLCPTGGDGAIAGRVTNLQTGGAISGATVSWSGGSATSDGTGAYSLTGVTPGTVTITARATGYLVRSYAVTVTGGSTATQDIQLSTSGKIVGTVSGNGAALGGASVRIQGGQIATDQTARTDAAGHYDQGWVPIGSYTVTCSAAGFSSQVVAPVTVATGATTTVDCALSSAGTVTGTVTNLATGGAIAGATVNYSGGSATSDSSGRYTIAGIPAGTVTLTGRATGYLARSYDVTVAGGSTTTQNIQLSTSGKIAGTVTGDGAALGGASVRIQGGQIATDQTASTDATGHYDQGWVPIGSYSVICSAAGYATKTISGVSVTSGATSTVDCPLTSRGTVTGKVTNLQTGGAIAGATVSSSGVSTTSDSAGNYTLSSLPAGTATVTATSNGYLARSYSTSVAAGGTTTQNVQLSTSGKLIGNVTHAGAALSGASVRIQGGQIPTDQTDTTDSAGHYDEGWVPIGSYTVTCSKPGFATQTLSNVTVTTGGTTTANCAL